jgi:hypothetical protein
LETINLDEIIDNSADSNVRKVRYK